MICKIYFLTSEFKEFLGRYISVRESQCIETCVEVVHNQYVCDYIKLYGLEKTNFILNFNLLTEKERELIDLNEPSVSLNYFIEDVFFSQKTQKFPFSILSKIIQNKFNLEDENYKDYIFTFIKKVGLNLGFHQRSKPITGKSLLFILNLQENSVTPESWSSMVKELEEETVKYLSSIKCPARSANWTEAERIRVINGIMRHCSRPNIFPTIFEDIIYGFYHTRPVKNALWDGVRNIFTKKNKFKTFN